MATFYLPSSTTTYPTISNGNVGWRIRVEEGEISNRSRSITVIVEYTRTYNATSYSGSGTLYCTIDGTQYSESITTDKQITINTWTTFFSKTLTIDGYDDNGDRSLTVTAYATGASTDNINSSSNGGTLTLSNIGALNYTVSYNANGGSGAPNAQTVAPGAELVISTTIPERSGYTFLGWSTSSSATTPTYLSGNSYSFGSSTTLYAVWELNKYYISYSGAGGTNYPETQIKTHGTSIIISDTVPSRPGYTFKGWGELESSTVLYSPGSTYSTEASIVLYAIWSANSYTITLYDDSDQSNNVVIPVTFDSTQNNTLRSYIPTRPGYVFLGWFDALADGTPVYRADGSCINNGFYWLNDTYVYPDNCVLYTYWKPLNIAYYRMNDKYYLCYTYIKQDGKWHKAVIYQKINGQYKHNDTYIRFSNDGVVEASTFIEKDDYTSHFEHSGEITATSFIEHSDATYYFDNGVLYARKFKET